MRDLSLLLWIAGVGSIVVPALICAFCGPVENSSRAIKNDTRRIAQRNRLIPIPGGPTNTTGDDVLTSSHAWEIFCER